MKSKKAMLIGEHAVELLFAGLVIIAIVAVGVMVFNNLRNQQEVKMAQNQLESLKSIIEELQKDGGTKEYLILNPSDWAVVGWPYISSSSSAWPKYCEQNGWVRCLCMCDVKVSSWKNFKGGASNPNVLKDYCDINKICMQIKATKFKVNPVETWFPFINSDLKPLLINDAIKSSGGKIIISYDKNKDELRIDQP